MKFYLFLQKNLFRLTMFLALFAFLGVFHYAIKLDEKERADIVTRLPGEMSLGKASVTVDGQQPVNPLATQHLGTNEVSMRFSDVLAESLSFNSQNFSTVTSSVRKYFTQAGYEQYLQFLSSSGFQEKLSAQNLQAGTYIEEEPTEMGRGVYDGVYKWVFQVPVKVSLIPRVAGDYKTENLQAQNRAFILRAQFARVNDPQEPGAIKIELWQVFPARR